MENHLQNTPEDLSLEEIPSPPGNLWGLMLRRPKAALDYLYTYQEDLGIHRNFVLAGFFLALAARLPEWLATGGHPVEVMIICFVAGPFGGLFAGYIFAAIAQTIGKWLGYPSDKMQFRMAAAWSSFAFGMSYLVFSLGYLLAYSLRPVGSDKFLIGTSDLIWIPVSLFAVAYIYAMWLRWKSLAYAMKAPIYVSVLGWFVGFIFTYIPLAILSNAYFGLYTVSIEGMMAP